MIILKSRLKKVIVEETKKLLLERELRSFILESLTKEQRKLFNETGELPEELIEAVMDWMRKKGRKIASTAHLIAALMGPTSAIAQPATSPVSVTAQVKESAVANIHRAAENTKKQLVERFSSSEAAEAFLNFSRSMASPTFKEQSDEQIKKHFKKEITPKLLNIVQSINVLNTTEHQSQIPKNVINKFADNLQVGGLYDSATNAIYMNPSSFEQTGEVDLKTITSTMMEEFFHAIDSNMNVGDLFPSLAGQAQAGIQFATSKSLARSLMGDIIMPQAKEDYAANPQEFYAKFQVIKSKLKQKYPDFFDERGNIDKEALENILSTPRMYFDTGEVDFRIFDILNKKEGEKIKQYFDQLVKVRKKAPISQMA